MNPQQNEDDTVQVVERRSRKNRRAPRGTKTSALDTSVSVVDESVILEEVPNVSESNNDIAVKQEPTTQHIPENNDKKDDILTTNKLLSIDRIHKQVRKQIESSNTSSSDESSTGDNSKYVLALTENQIKLRLQIAKERMLTALPEAVIDKICEIFTIASCYLWKVEEKQNFLLQCFGSSYMLALREILMKFYIPLKDDPMTTQENLRFLVPEEVNDFEQRDRFLEEQQQVISAMIQKPEAKDKPEGEIDSSLYDLIQKHQERYKYRQSKFLTGLANPENFLKDADLFRQQRIKKAETQRKQRQAILDRKKLAHSSTIKAEVLPDNRFTAGIKVKSKKKRKK